MDQKNNNENTEVSTIRFDDFDLNPSLLKALKEVGYETPTPIQARIIPHVLEGKDVIGQAETGTGKTAAFALPLLSKIDPKLSKPQVLVLVPTRELSIQVAEAFQRYASHLKNFHILPIYGGQDYNVQLRPLKRGVHVVVGTPGRVMDHMRRGSLVLDDLSCLVLDEADEMLRMGFIDDVEWVLEQTPPTRQVALFSATMPNVIKKIAQKHLNNPVEVSLKVRSITASTIRQRYWVVKGHFKLDALTRFLEAETFDGIIIFVRTKNATVELSEKLSARGYACSAINGDMAQRAREKAVDNLKSGKLDILIATDVAARGLDVERISHVINFDIPYDNESYIHRIGRTGRAGRSGEAILFVSPRETHLLRSIEKAIKQKIELMVMPSIETINQKRIETFKQKLLDALASPEMEFYTQLIEEIKQENDVPDLKIAAALAKQLQGDSPLLLVPGKEAFMDVSDDSRRGERQGRRGERGERSERGRRGERERPREKSGRNDREDRNSSERSEPRDRKNSKDKKKRRASADEWQPYRIEVGKAHKANQGQIVGAIANEAGLDSRSIGHIELGDQVTMVELPLGLSKEVLGLLTKTRVAGKLINISKWNEGAPKAPPTPRSNKKFKKRDKKKSK